MAAAGFVAVTVLAAVFAGLLAPHGPDDQDLGASLSGPSWAHPLGAGALGKDELSRMMYGGRTTLLSVVISLGVFLAVGVPAGLLAGYRGGWVDRVVVRVADIVFALPGGILLLVVLTVLPGDEPAAMVALGLLGAPGLARVVRAATAGVRGELYVRAALANGLGDAVILRRHVLPRVSGTIIVQASLFGAAAVGLETGLGFLNLGASGATWGGLVWEASQNVGVEPWLLIPTGTLLFCFILSLALIGDGVRDSVAESLTPDLEPPHREPESVTGDAADAPPPTTPRPDALLEVSGLRIAFPIAGRDVEVVSGVDFHVRRGEALGIVGESGSGKSVTAAAILGLLRGGHVTAGRLTFDGEAVAEQRALRGRRIGLIAQDPLAGLDPSFTIGSQLAEVVRTHHGGTRREARIRALDLLRLVRLPDPERVAQSYPHQLSGGMAQRAGIAAALAGEPDLVIADEPTTALDVTVQAEILDVLRTLRSTGTAVILVTHDWGVLADFCERAVVMYAGQVVETADVSELVAEPRHPYTAGLLASNPSHAMPGRPIPAIEGTIPAPGDWPRACRFAERCPLVADECRTAPVPMRTVAPDRGSRCLHSDAVPPPLAGSRHVDAL
jgi:peptide/nickel transport system permease protein